MILQQARLYTQENGKIRCGVCNHYCKIKEGGEGLCGARQVKDGELLVNNYGLCVAAAMDPIEKKPLYHFYPGRDILSLGTWGCNFQCVFCQNWTLARGCAKSMARETQYLEPLDVLNLLEQKHSSSVGIAFTYNEPTIWFEYVYDTAKLVSQYGYKNVLVTNGFISPQALEQLAPYIDALNIDVKSFQDEFYQRYCKGSLQAVQETVEYCARNFHLEVTCLIIPTLNDTRQEIQEFVDWLASLNPDIPLHFSRYFPQYKLSLPPTPVETLTRVRRQAQRKLRYVYIGNVPGSTYANTLCPRCSRVLIRRGGYRATNSGLNGRLCSKCAYKIHLTGSFPS